MAKTNKKKESAKPEAEAVPDIIMQPDEAADAEVNRAAEETAAESAPAAEDTAEAEDIAAALAAERDKYMRLYAEYDNYRKRSAKEREALYTTVRAEVILRMLPVYDNLERALKLECADEAFLKGIEMTMTQFSEILENMGVSPIKAVGEVFDPAVHNAVFNMQDESYGEKIIIEETQKGFMIGDRVIRFASVVVAN